LARFSSLQRQEDASREHRQPRCASSIPSITHDALHSPGEALNAADADFAGSRLNHDFSKVRIHSDELAAQSAAAIGASAYTYGSHIVFGSGRYQPGISEGKWLLMHELTHVIQQSGSGSDHSSPLSLDDPHGAAERAAERSSAAAMAGDPASPVGQVASRAGAIQRQPETAKTGGESSDPKFSATATNTTQGSGAPATGKQSQWTIEDSQVDFWISKQVGWGASFRIAGFSKATGPGFNTWSNPGIFNIIPNEHVWLTSSYWVDKPEHPIPWDQYKPAVFNEIKFTPSDGGNGVKVRYDDDHPTYQGPGKALKVNLGSKSSLPEAVGLPICDLPLNGGGSLTWRAGFKLGRREWSAGLDETFRLESTAPPVSSGSAMTGPGAGSVGPVPDTSSKKGQPLPPPPIPSKKSVDDTKVREIQIYTEGVKKAQDAVSKDELVRKLRDALSEIQPFLPAKEAQKMIDDALRSLVKDGIDSGIKAILQAITGKSPSTMPPGGSSGQIGPYAPSDVKGTQIFQGPKITIPDTPRPKPRTSFQYKGLRKSYSPGETIKITVLPPQKSETMTGKRVVIVADADRDKLNPTRLAGPISVSDKDTDVELKAPDTPGKYVIRIDVGMNFDYSSIEEFEVKEAKKQ
jgi:hypothetical protein